MTSKAIWSMRLVCDIVPYHSLDQCVRVSATLHSVASSA